MLGAKIMNIDGKAVILERRSDGRSALWPADEDAHTVLRTLNEKVRREKLHAVRTKLKAQGWWV